MLCMHILDLSMYLPNSGDFTVKVILSVCEILEILQDNPPNNCERKATYDY